MHFQNSVLKMVSFRCPFYIFGNHQHKNVIQAINLNEIAKGVRRECKAKDRIYNLDTWTKKRKNRKQDEES